MTYISSSSPPPPPPPPPPPFCVCVCVRVWKRLVLLMKFHTSGLKCGQNMSGSESVAVILSPACP
jgi:hypothetical protein